MEEKPACKQTRSCRRFQPDFTPARQKTAVQGDAAFAVADGLAAV
jgi:hypothetical protein